MDLLENGLWLSELEPVYSCQGWCSLNKNLSVSTQVMKAKGVAYSFGLGVYAPSRVKYAVPEGWTHLRGEAALDDAGQYGRVLFKTKLDSQIVWNSGAVDISSEIKSFDLPLNGAKLIELIVDDLGDKNSDHADWLNIRLINAQ